MSEKKTSIFSNGLIWFGAAISIAEILTGTYIVDMGVRDGILSIILGHAIGCVLLYLAGIIGAREEKSSMETTKLSFGFGGSYLFSILNIFQLVGWTAIMINQGANAANAIWGIGAPVWSIILGAFIAVWILVGVKNLGVLNTVVMSALLILMIVLSIMIFKNPSYTGNTGAMSFGAALELSIAMPMSWLPVISDYTREADKKTAATAVSVIVYGAASSLMFMIGFFAAMFTGEYEIAQILKIAGVGIIGLLIVIASTGTTTFIDAYSTGVSMQSVTKKLSVRTVGIITCVIGVILSIFAGGFLANLESFLYIIAGVFAPMIAIMIADYFILKNDFKDKKAVISNLVIWAIGFIAYYCSSKLDLPFGYTVPVVLVIIILTVIVGKARENMQK